MARPPKDPTVASFKAARRAKSTTRPARPTRPAKTYTPEQRAGFAERRYNIADRWWQESPLGAAAQRGRTQQRARPRTTAPAARGPVRTGGRMGPNFGPQSARRRVLPTQNRLSGSSRFRRRAAASRARQASWRSHLEASAAAYPGSFMSGYGPTGAAKAAALAAEAGGVIGSFSQTPSPQATQRSAFNRWRRRGVRHA